MNTRITGAAIKALRKSKGLTQAQLAGKLSISSKAISKWETGKGLPDITLIEPLADALGVSVMELMSGSPVVNKNVSCNMLRTHFYVCPVCGNIIHATGDVLICCCGIALSALTAKEPDDAHAILAEDVEDEKFLTLCHEMTKSHYISFLAYVTSDSVHLVKLYPEGSASARLRLRGHGYLYAYCNKHGLVRKKV